MRRFMAVQPGVGVGRAQPTHHRPDDSAMPAAAPSRFMLRVAR
jgi:hypothetical protein